MKYVIHPYYTGRDKGCITVGCDCNMGDYPHEKGCAIFSGKPLTFESEMNARFYARDTLHYYNGGYQIRTLEDYLSD